MKFYDRKNELERLKYKGWKIFLNLYTPTQKDYLYKSVPWIDL